MTLGSPLPAARLRRRLIRELVAENLALIEGTHPARRRRPRPLRDLTRLLLVLMLAATLFRWSNLLAGSDRGQEPSLPASASDLPGANSTAPPGPTMATTDTLTRPALAAPASLDPSVFPLVVRRVAIDAGHGGSNSGATAPRGVVEKELTLDIARRLERLLADSRFETLMTRESDRDVSLRERARLANEAGADLFLSIHLNWLEDPAARGIETYYAGINNDPAVNRVALQENAEYGNSFADLKLLLERLYTDVREEESKVFANVVQNTLYRSLTMTQPLVQNRGVKAAPFTVLISTDMPSVLAEVSCVSNEEESRLLMDPEYRQTIANALAQSVRSYAATLAATSQKGS